MDNQDSQKSEIHDTTADASTSPTAADDALSASDGSVRSSDTSTRSSPARDRANDLSATAHIVRDDTDNGGPLVIETDQPIS